MNEHETIAELIKSWPNFGPVLIILYLGMNKIVNVIKEHRSLVEAIDELKAAVKEQTISFHDFTVCMKKVVEDGETRDKN